MLSEQIVTLNVSRSNQETIDYYRSKPAYLEREDEIKPDRKTKNSKNVVCSSQDIVFQLIHIGLRFTGKSDIKDQIADTIIPIIRKICQGRRFLRCHLELIYQFTKTKVNKIIAKAKAKRVMLDDSNDYEGYARINYCTKMLHAIMEQKNELGPQNYFFFSGYLSGILLNSKPL